MSMSEEKKISVVFMGTPEFALFPLQSLIEHPRIDVTAVITQPDKKTGRKQVMTPSPVKLLAKKNNIPILQPKKVKDKEFVKLIKELKPDFIVLVAFGQILPKELIEAPKYGSINIHGSLLPMHRGASPIQEALLKGETTTGVTIMKINEKLDEGDIYLMKRIPIEEKDDAVTLLAKLSVLGAILLPYVVLDVAKGGLKPIPQDHNKASYCTKIKKEDGEIDWKNKTAEQIKNKIRAFSVWPNCFTAMGNKQLKIIKADTLDKKAAPGEIVFINKKEIGIGTKKGILVPKEVQLEGKTIMQIDEFLRGYTETLRKIKSFTKSR